MEQKFYIGIGTKDSKGTEMGLLTGLGEFYKCQEKPHHPYKKQLHRVSADEFLEFLLINYKYIRGMEQKTSRELETIVNDDNYYIWETNGMDNEKLHLNIKNFLGIF